MKKTLTYIALTLAWPVVLYFAIGFVLWNLNAAEWSELNRVTLVVIGLCLAWVAPVFYHNNKKGLV